MDWGSILSNTLSYLLSPVTIAYALAATGLAVHFGYAGLLNFGMAGFMALGAYGYAISILTFGFPWWLAMLVGLVLVQAQLAARLTGETPVILLDEIAAHLDAIRRTALFDLLEELDAQAFMTGTDTTAFAPLAGRASMLAVSNGRIEAG